mmetsp:Transcript_24870/g.80452  ORF Transcript_24870/g.80452 Transcript_24870/m.80452 type:complete len:80 (-) Transcript_24870:2700-2939(-)
MFCAAIDDDESSGKVSLPLWLVSDGYHYFAFSSAFFPLFSPKRVFFFSSPANLRIFNPSHHLKNIVTNQPLHAQSSSKT